jgi:hypothetical protein
LKWKGWRYEEYERYEGYEDYEGYEKYEDYEKYESCEEYERYEKYERYENYEGYEKYEGYEGYDRRTPYRVRQHLFGCYSVIYTLSGAGAHLQVFNCTLPFIFNLYCFIFN